LFARADFVAALRGRRRDSIRVLVLIRNICVPARRATRHFKA
jgi:hypothetical protein